MIWFSLFPEEESNYSLISFHFFNWRLQQGGCLTDSNFFLVQIIAFHPTYYSYSSLVLRCPNLVAQIARRRGLRLWGLCCRAVLHAVLLPSPFTRAMGWPVWAIPLRVALIRDAALRAVGKYSVLLGDPGLSRSPTLPLDWLLQSRASWNNNAVVHS